MRKTDSFEKTLVLGKIEGGRRGDDMVGWPHRLNGHEFRQTPGVGDGQGGLAFCSPWFCKELDTTEQLNLTELIHKKTCIGIVMVALPIIMGFFRNQRFINK